MTEKIDVLDSILSEVGEFGKYQRRTIFFVLVSVIIIYFSSILYVFETKYVNHRCKIVGCDVEANEYMPDWWTHAIPSSNGKPLKCFKFKRFNESNVQSCKASDFNHSEEESCNYFIYETQEISIMQDYNLQCDENFWKLTIVGTIHSCATSIGLPIFGMLSDRFGRKTIVVCGLVLSGVVGLGRSFANSYTLYIILECLDAFFRSGSFPTIWILGAELVEPNKRVLVTLLISTVYAFGGILQGLLAWVLQSWRVLLRITYALHLLIIFDYWLIPESITWLLAKKRFAEGENILRQMAKVNGKSISEDILKKLQNYESDKEKIKINTASELFRSATLMTRLVSSAVCGICCMFLYNGLTINSVNLSENSYLDYILTMAVEILGSIAYIVVDKVGRRGPLAGGFLLTGLAYISLIFVPIELYWLRICIHLMGKFGVSVSVSVLYTVTTEIFPTSFRSSLVSVCTMFAGFGAMAAPQVPLLGNLWQPLPLLMFGASGILAAFLSLLFPETKNTKLPNSIQEAENIGKNTM